MGQFSCKGWNCKNIDSKQEGEFRTSDFNIMSQGIKSKLVYHPVKVDLSLFSSYLNQIIALQANIRRFIYRSLYLKALKINKPNYYYFAYEEVSHFLSKKANLPLYREETSCKVYSHGGIYSGELKGGFRDGMGQMKWKDGAVYSGNWLLGRPAGVGKFIFPDGDSYEGQWKYYFSKGNENDVKGLGVVLWRENIKDGYKWLWYKKAICINSPRSISMTPRNEEILSKVQEKYIIMRTSFEKQSNQVRVSKDLKERRFPDGALYKGDMQGVKRHGYGKIVWSSGDVYEGEWKDDIQSGWGKNVWKEGAKYIGYFCNNVKDGIGKYLWEDGNEYFGEWKEDKMEGVGRYNWTDGKLYLGQWVGGLMEGFGVLMWKDGRKYEGEWSSGKKHGEGLTFYSNGRVSRDIWRYGKIIRPDV